MEKGSERFTTRAVISSDPFFFPRSLGAIIGRTEALELLIRSQQQVIAALLQQLAKRRDGASPGDRDQVAYVWRGALRPYLCGHRSLRRLPSDYGIAITRMQIRTADRRINGDASQIGQTPYQCDKTPAQPELPLMPTSTAPKLMP